MAAPARKRRTNVTLDSTLLDAARDLGLNVSEIAETALAETVRKAQADAWQAENAEAIQQRRAWIETNGPPLSAWQSWRAE